MWTQRKTEKKKKKKPQQGIISIQDWDLSIKVLKSKLNKLFQNMERV